MRVLYKAYACEKIDGEKLLLPGYVVDSTSKPVPAGAKIKVELADGTILETHVVKMKLLNFTESTIDHLKMRVSPFDFYNVIQVPDDFSIDSIYLGVKVYLED